MNRWQAPDTPEGEQLAVVLDVLRQRWYAGAPARNAPMNRAVTPLRQSCLTNLPLLAELYAQAGVVERALVACAPWRQAPAANALILDLNEVHMDLGFAWRYRNEHPFLWFQPGELTLCELSSVTDYRAALYTPYTWRDSTPEDYGFSRGLPTLDFWSFFAKLLQSPTQGAWI